MSGSIDLLNRFSNAAMDPWFISHFGADCFDSDRRFVDGSKRGASTLGFVVRCTGAQAFGHLADCEVHCWCHRGARVQFLGNR